MWRDLAPVGRSASSGGYFRQPWTSAESELRAWFAEECAARGLDRRDRRHRQPGRLVAAGRPTVGAGRPHRLAPRLGPRRRCVRRPARRRLGPRGHRRAARRAASRRRGRSAIGVFVEEEGSRFGRACLGSRLVDRRDDLGRRARAPRPRRRLPRRRGRRRRASTRPPGCCRWTGSACFVELHVEQGRDLVDRDVAVGVASEIWPHGRWRFDFAGEANHAGTTRMEDRHDPMLTYAMTALAANKQARLAEPARDLRPDRGRAQRHQRRARRSSPPGSTRAPPPTTPSPTLVDADRAPGRATAPGRDGTSLTVTAESVSGSVAFDADLAARLAGARRLAGHPDPGRPRRRHPVRRRHPDRDGLRPQPDRRLALARRARRDGRLPGRGRGAGRRAGRAGPGSRMTAYLLERALARRRVPRRRARRGRGRPLHRGRRPTPTRRAPIPVRGLVVPGLANTHSHAFHRALRGRTQRERGTFWTWRDQMYAVAARLDPDTYLALARATYREMAAAGITCVGEFHYLHHQPDGTPYDDPNAMGLALVAGRARGRPPDHAARHALPLLGLRRRARGRAGALQRRVGRTAWATAASTGLASPDRRTRGSAPPSTPCAPCPPPTSTPSPALGRRPAPPRPPLRAGRRERRLPRGVRRHARAAARRPRPPRADRPRWCTRPT